MVMEREYRHGVGGGFELPRRQEHEPTPAERAERAKAIAGNLDNHQEQVRTGIAAMVAAQVESDPAAWERGRKQADSGVRSIQHAVDGALAAKADAVEPDVAAKLAGACDLLADMQARLAAAPAKPAKLAPALSCANDLLAVLPPDAPVSDAMRVYAEAERAVADVFRGAMLWSDIQAFGELLTSFPSHPIARRFGRFTPDRKQRLKDILNDSKVRARARATEAAQQQAAPLTAPPPGYGTRVTADAPSEHQAPALGDLPAGEAAAPSDVVVESAAAHSDAAPPVEPGAEPVEVPHRAHMEQAFGRDLGHVEAYTGQADALAPLGADAAAADSLVASADASPDAPTVAHELTHVVQQEQAGEMALAASGVVATEHEPAEIEASANAARVAAGGRGTLSVTARPGAGLHLQRSGHVAEEQGAQAAPPRAMDRATTLARFALQHLEAIQSTMVPAWTAAVSAMEPRAALEIAGHVIGGLTKIRDAEARLSELVPDVDPKAPQVSTAETDTYTDPADLALLIQLKAQLDTALSGSLPMMAVRLSPQMFDGEAVAGATEAPPKLRDLVSFVAFEANNVVELLDEANYIEQHLVMPTDEEGRSVPANRDGLSEAVDRLERKRSRPVNFFFLAAVLKKKGLWPEIQRVKSINGKTPDELERKVSAQAKETGATADVGFWDADSAHSSLTYGLTDWAVTDSDGSHVTNMLASAEPRARGELVMQLVRMDLLDRWASNVPWGHVQMIADSINDPQAERMLAPYWEGKGGVPSSREFFMEQVDSNLEEGGTINEVNAFGWFLLNKGLDTFSFGGKSAIDDAHEARDSGLISDDAYWSSVGTASARTLVIGAAAAWTGGVAGGWAEGAALGMGAGQGGAAVIGGAAGGAVGNVGGLFAADVYDQIVMGKEGFSDFSDYGKAFAEGGVAGTAFAGLSLGAARFMPKSAQNMAAVYAERHPQLLKVMEASRQAGYGASVRVRMKVSEYLDTFRGGGFGGGMAPALAGGGVANNASAVDVASMAPDAHVWVTVRPAVDLAAPAAARSIDEAGDPFEVESVEPAEGSLFDDYGPEASYADDAADWNGDPYGDGVSHAADDVADDIGLADPATGRRTRHVPESEMSPEMAADEGMGVLDSARLGIQRPDRHHTLPQEEIKFFQERGFPGQDIDNFTVDLDKLDHEMVHGGNQSMARRHWKDHEWNTELMRRLRDEEALLQAAQGPDAKLSRAEILEIMEDLRVRFGIDHLPYVHYKAP
ncbi:MAG: DUF4157 domain-containing protein [Myxococcales bacterium]|nr:DUF4157 domain-containing protein [Myxococcales bacterium]